VGLSHAGVNAVLAKSVARIFFRSAINQGLPIIVLPEAVEAYTPGDSVTVDLEHGMVTLNGQPFPFAPLPPKLMDILHAKGLVNWMRQH
jgi:3-isopropylmalate dehydratase small subunit